MSNKIAAIPSVTGAQDPIVKAALEAIIDGLQVRNGITGSGSDAFLTASDVQKIVENHLNKKQVGMIDGPGSVRISGGGEKRSAQNERIVTDETIFVSHPFLGKITLKEWINVHTEYTIQENIYLRNQLAEVNRRLQAGGL